MIKIIRNLVHAALRMKFFPSRLYQEVSDALKAESLQAALGLHFRLKVMYQVDGYLAWIYHESDDTETPYHEAEGQTIIEAIVNLNEVIKTKK